MPIFNPFRYFFKKVPTPLKNKYIFTLLLFFIWLFVFDKHRLLTQLSLSNTHSKLLAEKAFYEEGIQQTKVEKANINANLEKYAREKFYMKKKDEDVYIFVGE